MKKQYLIIGVIIAAVVGYWFYKKNNASKTGAKLKNGGIAPAVSTENEEEEDPIVAVQTTDITPESDYSLEAV